MNAQKFNEYRYEFSDWQAWQQLMDGLDRIPAWPSKEVHDGDRQSFGN